MKTYCWNGGIYPRILNLGTRWRWVVNFRPRPLYPRVKSPRYPLDRRLGPQSRSGLGSEVKKIPHWSHRELNSGSSARRLATILTELPRFIFNNGTVQWELTVIPTPTERPAVRTIPYNLNTIPRIQVVMSWLSTTPLHGATAQKTTTWFFIAANTSNLATMMQYNRHISQTRHYPTVNQKKKKVSGRSFL